MLRKSDLPRVIVGRQNLEKGVLRCRKSVIFAVKGLWLAIMSAMHTTKPRLAGIPTYRRSGVFRMVRSKE